MCHLFHLIPSENYIDETHMGTDMLYLTARIRNENRKSRLQKVGITAEVRRHSQ